MENSNSKHIVIGITGGIAAYKSLSLIRLFKAAHYEVKVVATKNALEFVTKLTIETLSQNKLYYDSFESPEQYSVEHITLADWADLVIVAPATANCIGKLTHGIADDALSTLLLAFTKPIFMAPAMNCNMYQHVAVQENIAVLKNRGVHFIDPTGGFLACGYEGKGRMEEPENIFRIVTEFLNNQNQFKGIKALVTAGPTYEPIDPVRFIGNHSSGLMGFAIADALAQQGAEVTLITGPTHLQTGRAIHQRIDVQTADEMFNEVMKYSDQQQLFVMAAAVADYTPKTKAPQKIKKKEQELVLELTKTKDILATIGHQKKSDQCVVGFALETENELQNGSEKLQNKKADFIVLNSMNNNDAGFNKPTNQVTILSKNGVVFESEVKTKQQIADEIIQTVYQNFFIP
ncbi:MAG: phosphopantothenoylcysteine decarboxylase/phosphopantothenate--cysteine ligase [Bacteroidetes bacterium]|nr:phosphopantothenoylcysteine decarboxylase/phosphopantothenate--cysteine ligase [Bacteroidota bacterium]